MSMTPNEIRNAEFGTSMRGFNREEVDQFMQKTATALEASLTETADLQERFDKLHVKYDKLVAMEDTLKSTLLEAQKTADTMRANAEKDVQLSLERARGKQEIIEEQARQQTVLLQDKIDELDKIRLDYQEKIQQTISSHMKLIEDISFSAEFPIDADNIVEDNSSDIEQTELEPAEIEEVTLFESVVDETQETTETEENPSLHSALTDLDETDAGLVPEELAPLATPSASEAIAQAIESTLPIDGDSDESLYKKLATDDTEPELQANSETDTVEETQEEAVAEAKKPKSSSALESGADGIVVFGRKEDREKAVEENARILSELDSVVDKFAEELREIDSK